MKKYFFPVIITLVLIASTFLFRGFFVTHICIYMGNMENACRTMSTLIPICAMLLLVFIGMAWLFRVIANPTSILDIYIIIGLSLSFLLWPLFSYFGPANRQQELKAIMDDFQSNVDSDLKWAGFYQSGSTWYYRGKIVNGAEFSTFRPLNTNYLDQYYAIDRQHIFYGTWVLQGADVWSFKNLPRGYALDNNHVYFLWKVLAGADQFSFRVMNDNFFADKNHVYDFKGNSLPGVNPNNIETLNEYIVKSSKLRK